MGYMIRSWVSIILGVLLLLVVIYTMGRLTSLGAFNQIEYATEHPAKMVAEVQGPEDLEIDGEQEMLYFISSNPCSKSPNRGGIYSLSLKNEPFKVQQFQFDHPQDFHPHGLSHFRQDGAEYLFTNNHRSDGTHCVEIFEIVEHGMLEHLESITAPLLTSPNDLVAIGPRKFYVTNDGRAHDRYVRSVDTFLGRKTGKVLFFDGKKFTAIVDNLSFPNGISLNISKKQIIISETLSGQIRTYQVFDNYSAKNVDNFYVGVGIDNISVSKSGTIIAAVHPNLWALSRHMNEPSKLSPSKVVRVDLQSRTLELLYQHPGDIISGVSAGVEFKGNIYMGAVCDGKLLKLGIRN